MLELFVFSKMNPSSTTKRKTEKQTKMMDLFRWLKPLFTRAKALASSCEQEHVECEFRYGKCNEGYFDTNIGKCTYDTVMRALRKYPHWEKVEHTNATCYYLESMRFEIDDVTEQVTVTDKRAEFSFQYTNLPHFDVRFSVAREKRVTGTPVPEVVDFMRHKQRVSFQRKNVSIDLTIVNGDAIDKDDDAETRYELEVEILDLRQITTDRVLFNVAYKLQCILDVLG